MMDEDDLQEHWKNTGMPQRLKKSDKFKYITGTQHTDQGSRTYDINGSRLPSVTTI